MASVYDRVVKIVSEQLGIDDDKITPETEFVKDLGADSLDTVEMVMGIEEEFSITISDEEALKMTTIGQAVQSIEEKLAS